MKIPPSSYNYSSLCERQSTTVFLLVSFLQASIFVVLHFCQMNIFSQPSHRARSLACPSHRARSLACPSTWARSLACPSTWALFQPVATQKPSLTSKMSYCLLRNYFFAFLDVYVKITLANMWWQCLIILEMVLLMMDN